MLFVCIVELIFKGAWLVKQTIKLARQSEMESAAEGIRCLTVRCAHMPENSKETRLLRKAVSHLALLVWVAA